jgi:hypothetical protein
MSGAGAANATCASISGLSAGTGCQSTPTSIAVGLGNNATADSFGLLNTAVAVGDGASASSLGALNLAMAVGPDSFASTEGSLNTAVAVGATGGIDNTAAIAGFSPADVGNVAISLGNDSVAQAGASSPTLPGFGNLALNLGKGSFVSATGGLNTAINVGGNQGFVNNDVEADGVLNNAINLGGNNNFVFAQGGTSFTKPGLNSAFNIGGSNNTATAGPGPGAIAGTVGGSGKVANRTSFGIDIK